MHLKIFGKLTEITGSAALELDSAPDTDALKLILFQRFPALSGMKFFIAVNNRMVQENTAFGDDAVVALMPPFSGG